jgi:aspartate carbamoyltransferase catalytic subunit
LLFEVTQWKRLGADVVNLELQLSSRVKGESMLDTVFTLEALHVDVFVLRDAEVGVPGMVAANVAPHVSVLSAGEAHLSHPTQGLLDALTVLQRKGRCDGLAIAIVGDIRHSRVARSACHAFRTLGVRDLRIVAPPGGRIRSIEIDGKPAPAGANRYQGRQMTRFTNLLSPGENMVIVTKFRTDRSMPGAPLLKATPSAHPDDENVLGPSACG